MKKELVVFTVFLLIMGTVIADLEYKSGPEEELTIESINEMQGDEKGEAIITYATAQGNLDDIEADMMDGNEAKLARSKEFMAVMKKQEQAGKLSKVRQIEKKFMSKGESADELAQLKIQEYENGDLSDAQFKRFALDHGNSDDMTAANQEAKVKIFSKGFGDSTLEDSLLQSGAEFRLNPDGSATLYTPDPVVITNCDKCSIGRTSDGKLMINRPEGGSGKQATLILDKAGTVTYDPDKGVHYIEVEDNAVVDKPDPTNPGDPFTGSGIVGGAVTDNNHYSGSSATSFNQGNSQYAGLNNFERNGNVFTAGNLASAVTNTVNLSNAQGVKIYDNGTVHVEKAIKAENENFQASNLEGLVINEGVEIGSTIPIGSSGGSVSQIGAIATMEKAEKVELRNPLYSTIAKNSENVVIQTTQDEQVLKIGRSVLTEVVKDDNKFTIVNGKNITITKDGIKADYMESVMVNDKSISINSYGYNSIYDYAYQNEDMVEFDVSSTDLVIIDGRNYEMLKDSKFILDNNKVAYANLTSRIDNSLFFDSHLGEVKVDVEEDEQFEIV